MELAGTRWRIIKELSKGDMTPTKLTHKLRISLPSVHAHLKQLEREKLVQRVKDSKGKTRPYTTYGLGEGFLYFIEAFPGEARKRILRADEDVRVQLRIWSIPQEEYHYYVESFWWELQKHLADIESVVVYGSVARGDARKGSDIDILLLVNKGEKKYGDKFGARIVGTREKSKIVMCQVFEADDFGKSLQLGSQFVAEVVKDGIVIYDPKKCFSRLSDGDTARASKNLPRRGRTHP